MLRVITVMSSANSSEQDSWDRSTLFAISLISLHRHSGSVVEHPLCDREVAGLIPGLVIPKTIKIGTSCSFPWRLAFIK